MCWVGLPQSDKWSFGVKYWTNKCSNGKLNKKTVISQVLSKGHNQSDLMIKLLIFSKWVLVESKLFKTFQVKGFETMIKTPFKSLKSDLHLRFEDIYFFLKHIVNIKGCFDYIKSSLKPALRFSLESIYDRFNLELNIDIIFLNIHLNVLKTSLR